MSGRGFGAGLSCGKGLGESGLTGRCWAVGGGRVVPVPADAGWAVWWVWVERFDGAGWCSVPAVLPAAAGWRRGSRKGRELCKS